MRVASLSCASVCLCVCVCAWLLLRADSMCPSFLLCVYYMHKCIFVCVCVCVCVSVCEFVCIYKFEGESLSVCMCVCVCCYEREQIVCVHGFLLRVYCRESLVRQSVCVETAVLVGVRPCVRRERLS